MVLPESQAACDDCHWLDFVTWRDFAMRGGHAVYRTRLSVNGMQYTSIRGCITPNRSNVSQGVKSQSRLRGLSFYRAAILCCLPTGSEAKPR